MNTRLWAVAQTVATVGVAMLAVSCAEPGPMGPITESASGPANPAEIQFEDTFGHVVDVPPNPRSLDEIEAEVREHDGLATVALKAPSSPRTSVRGYRAAISAAQAAQALQAVMGLGAELLDFFKPVNVAVVRIPSGRVRAIQTSAYVDWVEPAGPRVMLTETSKTPGARAPVAAQRLAEAPMAEVVPWNVSQVNAPAAWSHATGAGAKVMIMGGDGIAQHYDNPYITNCGGLAHACESQYIDQTFMVGNMLARENGTGVIGIAKGLAASDVYSWKTFLGPTTYDPWAEYSGLSAAYNLGYKLILFAFAHDGFDQTEANWIATLWISGGIVVAPIGDYDHQGNSLPSLPDERCWSLRRLRRRAVRAKPRIGLFHRRWILELLSEVVD